MYKSALSAFYYFLGMAEWVSSLSEEALDKKLTERDVSAICKYLLGWQDKARVLGLTDAEIENIREDHKNSNHMQKVAMMRRWEEKNGERATPRRFLEIARQNGWKEFMQVGERNGNGS